MRKHVSKVERSNLLSIAHAKRPLWRRAPVLPHVEENAECLKQQRQLGPVMVCVEGCSVEASIHATVL